MVVFSSRAATWGAHAATYSSLPIRMKKNTMTMLRHIWIFSSHAATWIMHTAACSLLSVFSELSYLFSLSLLFLSFFSLLTLLENTLLSLLPHNKKQQQHKKNCLYPFSFLFSFPSFFLLFSSSYSHIFLFSFLPSSFPTFFFVKKSNPFTLSLRVYIEGGWVWRFEGF